MTKEKQDQKPEFKDVQEVLHFIQKNLKVPKLRENKFGNYKFRNAEDILDAVKTIMPDGATLVIQDDIRLVGERYYVQAVASLRFKGGSLENCAYAREDDTKKGMDASQLTGATSSYARKYALNGLFMIDDTKDADETNKHGKTDKDQKAVEALGGSARNDLDAETIKQMYDQGIKNLTSCMDTEQLKKVWTAIYKGRSVFSPEQWQDLEDAKEATKIEIENTSPHM